MSKNTEPDFSTATPKSAYEAGWQACHIALTNGAMYFYDPTWFMIGYNLAIDHGVKPYERFDYALGFARCMWNAQEQRRPHE